jgi:hypothetical protein
VAPELEKMTTFILVQEDRHAAFRTITALNQQNRVFITLERRTELPLGRKNA